MICWVNCPDIAIKSGDVNCPEKGKLGITKPEFANFGGFDLEHCKGCGICASVCPTKAIVMKPETDFMGEDKNEN